MQLHCLPILNYQLAPKIFITEHRPKLYYALKKCLLDKFKEARKTRQKVYWKASNGEYCLYVNNIKIINLLQVKFEFTNNKVIKLRGFVVQFSLIA